VNDNQSHLRQDEERVVVTNSLVICIHISIIITSLPIFLGTITSQGAMKPLALILCFVKSV
jgi:hypothetical protein